MAPVRWLGGFCLIPVIGLALFSAPASRSDPVSSPDAASFPTSRGFRGEPSELPPWSSGVGDASSHSASPPRPLRNIYHRPNHPPLARNALVQVELRDHPDLSSSSGARLTTRVVDRLPNGHVVLEGRRIHRRGGETSVLVVSGVARPEDLRRAGALSSDRLSDLRVSRRLLPEGSR